jgi:hypothetical protein
MLILFAVFIVWSAEDRQFHRPSLRYAFEGISFFQVPERIFIYTPHFPLAGYMRHRFNHYRFIQPKTIHDQYYDMPHVLTFRQPTNGERLLCALRTALKSPSPSETARYEI